MSEGARPPISQYNNVVSTLHECFRITLPWAATALIAACYSAPAPAPPATIPLAGATQVVLVTTPGWDSTSGELRRFVRDDIHSSWRRDGATVPIVVGRTGLAWGIGFDRLAASGAPTAGPAKIEGDGRSPAGIFPLDTAFGFSPRDSMSWVRLQYVQLTTATDCVDDTASAHYNTVVQREPVVVQVPAAVYSLMRVEWGLPTLDH